MKISNLPLYLRYGEHEPAYSVLNRFALRHKLASTKELVGQLEGLPNRFVSAVKHGHHLDVVAMLTHVSAELLRKSTLSTRGNRVIVFDHVHDRLTPTSIIARWGRVCRACLMDDLKFRPGDEAVRPYRRFWWDVGMIKNCPIHGIPLTSTCPDCNTRLTHELLSPRQCKCGYDLARKSATRLPDEHLFIDTYFVERITSELPHRNDLLDPMPLNIIAGLINNIDGFVAESTGKSSQRHARAHERTISEQHTAIRPGILALQDWPTKFIQILDSTMDGKISKSDRAISPHYGSLYFWLSGRRREPSLSAVREVLKQHALSRFPISQALSLFPAIPITRSHIPLEEVAARCGITRGTANKLLNRTNKTVAKPAFTVVEVIFVDSTYKSSDFIEAKEAADRLGVGYSAFRAIVLAGILSVEAPSASQAMNKLFSKRWIDAVLRKAAGKAPTLTALPDGACSVMEASKAWRLPVRDILLALLRGQIQCVGRLGTLKGLSGFCLDQTNLKL